MVESRQGECRLCGTVTRLQDEDVFPTWARNELISNLADAPAQNQWPVRVSLRACAVCNHGLGSQFENRAAPIMKPLMRGDVVVLDRTQMDTVAAWSWLKDIEYILGRAERIDGSRSLSREAIVHWRAQLATLRTSGVAPDGYVVRLASVGSLSIRTQYKRFTPPQWGARRHFVLAGTNEVGYLIIESILTSEDNARGFARWAEKDARCSVIWPRVAEHVTVGATRVPLDHAKLWREEHGVTPNMGWGGGWRIPVNER